MTGATSSDLCTLLDRMSWAEAAARQARPRGRVRLHALPPTMWVVPKDGVGGSKASAHGALPATISWKGGTLRVTDTDDEPTTAWEVEAAGTRHAGSIRLETGQPWLGRPDRLMWPCHFAPILSSREAGSMLDGLQERGELARWEMLANLEEFAHQKIGGVASSIFREVAGVDDTHIAPKLLDDQQLDVVVTHVVYGRTGADSRILRGLQRCLEPQTTRKVDPIRYLTTQVRRDLADEVRVAIGDPQVGSRIRRVARALGAGASLEEIVTRYNEVHSSDRISTARAVRALTVAPSIESTALRHVFEVRDV